MGCDWGGPHRPGARRAVEVRRGENSCQWRTGWKGVSVASSPRIPEGRWAWTSPRPARPARGPRVAALEDRFYVDADAVRGAVVCRASFRGRESSDGWGWIRRRPAVRMDP